MKLLKAPPGVPPLVLILALVGMSLGVVGYVLANWLVNR